MHSSYIANRMSEVSIQMKEVCERQVRGERDDGEKILEEEKSGMAAADNHKELMKVLSVDNLITRNLSCLKTSSYRWFDPEAGWNRSFIPAS